MVTYADLIKRLQDTPTPTDETWEIANCVAVPEKKQTMLHIAAGVRESDDIVILLKHGARINATDVNGLTAFHVTAMSGRKDMGGDGFKPGSTDYAITMLLLEQGANSNQPCNGGWLPEHYTLEPRTGTTKQNTEDHADFLAIIETFKSRQAEKKGERTSSSDHSEETLLLTYRNSSDDKPTTEVSEVRHRHRSLDAKETGNERNSSSAKQNAPSSDGGWITWLTSALTGTGKQADSKSK